ncbi:M48 family peptidase [Puteibacter caeruleilacunae]|nr:M48 family peptidase [Puteibacter caeruleilacunae]
MSGVRYLKLIFLLAVVGLLNSCSTVPLTGRSQFSLVSESELTKMSLTSYQAFLDTNKVLTNSDAQMVKRVGNRISKAVEQYLRDNGFPEKASSFQWEFNLVDSDVPNAWCMPGGKVCFYTGILPYTKTEAGLAVVMGHEIAHAVANHGGERMSHGMLVQLGGVALSTALQNKPEETQAIYMGAFGAGSQLGFMLPFSRKHEYEADRMGLIFMAMAGYQPQEAVEFWKRMSQKSGGKSVPEFLSTHPVDMNRVRELEQLLPEAMKYYKKN